MNRTPVQSSNLVSVGYDPGRRVLEIEFRRGRVYEFKGVPQRVYVDLMDARSHGKYFHRNINGQYRYRRLQ